MRAESARRDAEARGGIVDREVDRLIFWRIGIVIMHSGTARKRGYDIPAKLFFCASWPNSQRARARTAGCHKPPSRLPVIAA